MACQRFLVVHSSSSRQVPEVVVFTGTLIRPPCTAIEAGPPTACSHFNRDKAAVIISGVDYGVAVRWARWTRHPDARFGAACWVQLPGKPSFNSLLCTKKNAKYASTTELQCVRSRLVWSELKLPHSCNIPFHCLASGTHRRHKIQGTQTPALLWKWVFKQSHKMKIHSVECLMLAVPKRRGW